MASASAHGFWLSDVKILAPVIIKSALSFKLLSADAWLDVANTINSTVGHA
jgi:hypothetical protein